MSNTDHLDTTKEIKDLAHGFLERAARNGMPGLGKNEMVPKAGMPWSVRLTKRLGFAVTCAQAVRDVECV